MPEETNPWSRWNRACREAMAAVVKADFENAGGVALEEAEKLLTLAHELKYGKGTFRRLSWRFVGWENLES